MNIEFEYSTDGGVTWEWAGVEGVTVVGTKSKQVRYSEPYRRAATEPATAAPSQIKTWHERTDKMDDSSIIAALKSENADLRAALARAESRAEPVVESANLVTIRGRLKAAAEAGAPLTLSGKAACALYYAMDTGQPMERDESVEDEATPATTTEFDEKAEFARFIKWTKTRDKECRLPAISPREAWCAAKRESLADLSVRAAPATTFTVEQVQDMIAADRAQRAAPATGGELAALTQARDALNGLLKQFTRTPSTLADSHARANGHSAVQTIDALLAAQATQPQHQEGK